MNKKVEVVLLPHDTILYPSDMWQIGEKIDGTEQHLYFISDDPIAEGDLCYNGTDTIFTSPMTYSVNGELLSSSPEYANTNWQKIIATTDMLLKIPLIPQSFTEEYIEKQGKFGKVKLELKFNKEKFVHNIIGQKASISDENYTHYFMDFMHQGKGTWINKSDFKKMNPDCSPYELKITRHNEVIIYYEETVEEGFKKWEKEANELNDLGFNSIIDYPNKIDIFKAGAKWYKETKT